MKIPLLRKVLEIVLTPEQRDNLHNYLEENLPEWEVKQRCMEMDLGIFRKFE